jgi:YVTN family beta-propeller protein
VYAACSDIDSVVCINAMTHQIIRSLHAPDNPTAMAYSSVSNKVYCVSPDADSVLVIDCAGDTAIRCVFVGDHPSGLAYAGAANKLYCANNSSGDIAVIDCDSDTVAKRIALPSWPLSGSSPCWDSVRNRLYVASANDELVYVIDCTGDSLMGSITTSGFLGGGRCLSADNGMLYWGCTYPSDLLGIDPTLGIQVDTTPLGRSLDAAAWNRLRDKTYVAADRELAVIDGSSRSVVGTISLGKSRAAILEPDSMHTVYVLTRRATSWRRCDITAVDTRGDTLLDWTIDVDSCEPVAGTLLWNPSGDKLYCAGYYTDQLLVIDCASAQIAHRIAIPGPWKLSHNSADNKVYCSSKTVDSLYVVDSDTDTVEAVLGFGYPGYGHLLAYDAAEDKEYALALGIGTLAAIDGSGNFIVDSIQVHDYGPSLLWSPAGNKLYSGDMVNNKVTVVDCATDSVVARDSTRGDPNLLCVDTYNNNVYVGVQYPNRLVIISGVTNGIADTFPLLAPPSSVTWIAIEGHVYVGEGSASCVAVFADDHVPLRSDEVPLPHAPVRTIVRGALSQPEAEGVLLDISGRRVVNLRPGANDVKSLPAGIYFVRDLERGGMQRVVIVQ